MTIRKRTALIVDDEDTMLDIEAFMLQKIGFNILKASNSTEACKLFEDEKDDAGKLARQVLRELGALWTFLDQTGVEPTNNRAERALRFGVLWRKRSLGTKSEKGNRWVERILSLKETCRLRSKPTFPVLVEMLASWFNNCSPDLAWI